MKTTSTPETMLVGQKSDHQCGNTDSSIYDAKSEDRLFKVISQSRQPILPTELSHEISPLTQRLVDNPQGFSDLMNALYNEFKADLFSYLQRCQNNIIPKETYAKVLIGLLKKFTKERERFSQYDLDKLNKENFMSLSHPEKKIEDTSTYSNYAQKAIKYNYEAGLIQIGVINRGISDIQSLLAELQIPSGDLQNIPDRIGKSEDSNSNDNCLDIIQPDFVGNPDYKFKVIDSVDFNIHITLDSLYQAVKHKYINCTYSQFTKVFLSEKPKPIVWLKSFSSLSYMIKLMKGRFIETDWHISIYKVATLYFHQGEIGQYFHPPRYKCEVKDLSKREQSNLDNIFSNLTTKIDRPNFHSKNLMPDLSEFGAKRCKKNQKKTAGYMPILPANSTRLQYPSAY